VLLTYRAIIGTTSHISWCPYRDLLTYILINCNYSFPKVFVRSSRFGHGRKNCLCQKDLPNIAKAVTVILTVFHLQNTVVCVRFPLSRSVVTRQQPKSFWSVYITSSVFGTQVMLFPSSLVTTHRLGTVTAPSDLSNMLLSNPRSNAEVRD